MKQTLRKLFLLALACALLCAAMPVSAEELSSTEPYGCFSGIAVDGDSLVVTDIFNKVVWRVRGSEYAVLAGSMGHRETNGEITAGTADGSLLSAGFTEPWAIVPYQGGWAVSEAQTNKLRLISETVTTLAGSGNAGLKNGAALEASFSRPTGLAVDDSGNLYIADTGNGAIRMLNTSGMVSTVYDGLKTPTGLCWSKGILYIAETGKNRIVALRGNVLLQVAGDPGTADENLVYEGGFSDGSAFNALFRGPQGLAAAPDGTIYVADTDNGAIRRIRNGMVSTIARSSDDPARLASPRGLVLAGDTLYCADMLSGGICSLSVAPLAYPDAKPGDWFYGAVTQATEIGLLKGTDLGFEPNLSLTRAMFVTILSRLQQALDNDIVIDGDGDFPDLPAESWYTAPARWAADAGVVKGMDDGTFSGGLSIQRQQLVTMLYRFAAANSFDVSARADFSACQDADSVQSYACDAMRWAVAVGIINGFEDGTLRPMDSATRAQAAAIMVRFLYCIEF